MASYSFFLLLVIAACASTFVDAKLSPNYYSKTCPKVESVVHAAVMSALNVERNMGASLLRLHFHDCFVNGCDGSVLLDDINGTFIGEKTATPNYNSLRGFNVIDDIKAQVEKACPGVVSCADILALAARDSVVRLGGPHWKVGLGRRDSLAASKVAANYSLPSATANLSALLTNFAKHGLSLKNMVALSGAHTIGNAQCSKFRGRIYNDTNIDPTFADSLQKICPRQGNDTVLAPLDTQTAATFDNLYYVNLVKYKGILGSDQQLFSGNYSSDYLVKKYARRPFTFFKDFAKAMIKMGNLSPLTGSQGEVRINCRRSNFY